MTQLPPLRSSLESPEQSNIFCLNAVKLACENDGGGITSLCDGDFSWLLRIGEIEGVGAVELVCVGRLSGWVMNLFYCLCGDLLEVGSPVKESRMPGNFMGWEEDGLV